MFCKGDKIVYPLYGAGVIEDLEEKEVDGNSQTYYVMRLPVGNLTIMVSAGKAEVLGIRRVYEKEEVMSKITSVAGQPVEMSENWNDRYKENMDKIKSGKLDEVALVFRNLLLRERERGLSSAEKKVLTTAKSVILSEMILSYGIEKNNAEELLTQAVDREIP